LERWKESYLVKTCSYCGRENEESTARCAQCGSELPPGSPAGLDHPDAKAGVACPACGAVDDYKAAIVLRGSFNWAVCFLGGLLGILFHNASRRQRVQCNACGEFFEVRSFMSKVSLLLFWLLMAPAVIVLLLMLLTALFSR